MAGPNGSGTSPGITLHPWYGLLTVAYMGALYWQSSLPGFDVGRDDPVVQLASNLLHIPLFAGLTYCFAGAISGGKGRQGLPWRLLGLTFLGTGAYAALDEWHQSFVPGRHATVSDFVLDLVGIGGMLVMLRLGTPLDRARGAARNSPSENRSARARREIPMP